MQQGGVEREMVRVSIRTPGTTRRRVLELPAESEVGSLCALQSGFHRSSLTSNVSTTSTVVESNLTLDSAASLS
jgi:hypothetical protein